MYKVEASYNIYEWLLKYRIMNWCACNYLECRIAYNNNAVHIQNHNGSMFCSKHSKC